MAQAPAEEKAVRQDDDNGFTIDYGKFTVVVMKEWGYIGTDDNYAYFLIDNASKEVLAVDPKGLHPLFRDKIRRQSLLPFVKLQYVDPKS